MKECSKWSTFTKVTRKTRVFSVSPTSLQLLARSRYSNLNIFKISRTFYTVNRRSLQGNVLQIITIFVARR